MVLAEVKELKDISMPWLQVDSKGTRTLVAALVDISGGVVEHTKHGYNSVGGAVGSSNVRSGGTDTVDVKADTSGSL